MHKQNKIVLKNMAGLFPILALIAACFYATTFGPNPHWFPATLFGILFVFVVTMFIGGIVALWEKQI